MLFYYNFKNWHFIKKKNFNTKKCAAGVDVMWNEQQVKGNMKLPEKGQKAGCCMTSFYFWIIRNAIRMTIETFLKWIHSFSTWKNPDEEFSQHSISQCPCHKILWFKSRFMPLLRVLICIFEDDRLKKMHAVIKKTLSLTTG